MRTHVTILVLSGEKLGHTSPYSGLVGREVRARVPVIPQWVVDGFYFFG